MIQHTATAATETIVTAHGGGGEIMNRLIRDRLLPRIANDTLSALGDGAVLPQPAGMLVFTTDSYVVTPIEFPGGDIGRLAVCGTVNDLAVMGATPLHLSLGLILEEGLPLATLDRVMQSIGDAAREANIRVVTGDTKVIERRGDAAPGLFINTAGVGVLPPGREMGVERVQVGDRILINGPIADHGLAVMSLRNGMEFETPLQTDAAPLNALIAAVLEACPGVRFMRDATRGGVAGVFADLCAGCGQSVEIDEAAIPLSPTARHASEILGLDPLEIANEGKVVMVVAEAEADAALAVLRAHEYGRGAQVIGRVTDTQPPLVELLTTAGGRRIVQRPYGEQLPRIC